MAAVALATGIGPADLLAAPPEVYAALLDLLEDRGKQARRDDLREKLRRSVQ